MLPEYEVLFPVLLLFAWLVGEVAVALGIPRIVSYGVCGLAAGIAIQKLPTGELPDLTGLADAAMGLLLFELGYRLNPSWLIRKPSILFVSLVESSLTFLAVFLCCAALSVRLDQSLAIASICIATSPGAVLRTVREKQSSGQVTNFLLTFSALNCVISILVFKLISGVCLLMNSPQNAAVPGVILLALVASVLSGLIAAVLLHGFDSWVRLTEDAKAFSIAMFGICLAISTHSVQLSPALACIVFGMSVRQSGMKIPGKFQDFGSLGKLSVLFLFVYLSSRLDVKQLVSGLPVGICIVLVRTVVKTLVPLQFVAALGCGKRKAFLVGLGMWPVSAYAMTMLEQARNMGVDLLSSCPPIITVIVLLEILGPFATSIAIDRSREATVER